MGVTSDTTSSLTEIKNISKYQDLKNTLKDECKLTKVDLIPVIIGNTGLMKKLLKITSKEYWVRSRLVTNNMRLLGALSRS